MTIFLVWLTCLAVYLTLDAIWLGLVSGSLYSTVLGEQMLQQIRIVPAVMFYVSQITGILVFVLPRVRREAAAWTTLWRGTFFGLCTYGTYDLTNLAVLRAWTWQVTLVDMSWGAFVTGIASLAGSLVQRMRAHD